MVCRNPTCTRNANDNLIVVLSKNEDLSLLHTSIPTHLSLFGSSDGVLEYSTCTRVQLEYDFLSTRIRNPRYLVSTRTRRSMYSVEKSVEYTSTFGFR